MSDVQGYPQNAVHDFQMKELVQPLLGFNLDELLQPLPAEQNPVDGVVANDADHLILQQVGDVPQSFLSGDHDPVDGAVANDVDFVREVFQNWDASFLAKAKAPSTKRRMKVHKKTRKPAYKKRNEDLHIKFRQGADVVCIASGDIVHGRGGNSNHHPGNKEYRKIIMGHKLVYWALETDKQKKEFAAAVYRSLSESKGLTGRFKDPTRKSNNGLWLGIETSYHFNVGKVQKDLRCFNFLKKFAKKIGEHITSENRTALFHRFMESQAR